MRGRKGITWFVLGAAGVAVAAAVVTQVELTKDDAIAAPKSGGVTGVITPAECVKAISVVSRQTGVTAEPAEFEPSSGRFSFCDLPGDAAYDVVVETTDGRTIEGIDLSFADARLLRLAELRRAQLAVPAEETHVFTDEDVKEILGFVQGLDDFMALRRPLYVAGFGRRATVLVELMRVREFHAADGNIIWRMELWYFEYSGGGWVRVENASRLLRRVKATPAEWGKIDVEYRRELSVFIDSDGNSAPVAFTIGDAADPSRGRPAGTEPELLTEPHVTGVSEVDGGGDAGPLDLNAPAD